MPSSPSSSPAASSKPRTTSWIRSGGTSYRASRAYIGLPSELVWNPSLACGVLHVVVGRPLDETELVALAQGGDAAAYEELVRMHQGIAFRTAFVVAGSAADAEDAAQDAFVKAYRALGRFRRGAPFRPWLLRIVANEARNRRRSAVRRERLTLRAATEDRPGDAVPSPEAALLTREAQEQLLAAVERLSDDHRDAV